MSYQDLPSFLGYPIPLAEAIRDGQAMIPLDLLLSLSPAKVGKALDLIPPGSTLACTPAFGGAAPGPLWEIRECSLCGGWLWATDEALEIGRMTGRELVWACERCLS